MYFSFDLVDILPIFILSVKNREGGGFLLNRQNVLSVTKVICQQSLNGKISYSPDVTCYPQ